MDTSVWWSGDLFSAMRATLGADRAREHLEAHAQDETVTHHRLRAEQVVDWATRGGAKALGMDSLTGQPGAGQEGRRRADQERRLAGDVPAAPPVRARGLPGRARRRATVVRERPGRQVRSPPGSAPISARHGRRSSRRSTTSRGELGPEAWSEGMHPEIPETRVLDNPYTYTYTEDQGPAAMTGLAAGHGGRHRRPCSRRSSAATASPGGGAASLATPTTAGADRITAAPVNPLDLLCASGTSYFGAPALPYVPGTRGVGIVVEADDIPAGLSRSGSAAARACSRATARWRSCARPCVGRSCRCADDVSDDLAAALGLSAIAAWMALTWQGRPAARRARDRARRQRQRRPGSGCRPPACSGRDGWWPRAGTRMAAPAPPSSVPTPSPTCPAMTPARSRRRWRRPLRRPGRPGADPVWGRPAEAAMRVLSPRGKLVNLGSSAAAPGQPRLGHACAAACLSVLGYTNNVLTGEQKAAALGEILTHAAAGRLTADRETLPLDRAAEGWSAAARLPTAAPS